MPWAPCGCTASSTPVIRVALPIGLGLLWAAVVVAAGWRARPGPVRRLWSEPAPEQTARPPMTPAVGYALAGVIALAVDLLVGIAVGVVIWMVPHRRRAQRRRREHAETVEELPEAVDLLRLAVSSGLNVHLAVAAVGDRLSGPVGSALAGAADRAHAGERLADALEALPASVGEPVRPLVRVLVDGDRYGTELAPALEQLATDSRLQRRRRAEEQARRLPLRLLLPLVTCILPAFMLLTLAPVMAETLIMLRP